MPAPNVGHIAFKLQYDFVSSDPFKDNYIALTDLPGGLTLRFGKMYEPFSMDDLTSSNYLSFMERSLPLAFSPGRNLGFDAQTSGLDERLTVRAGAYRPQAHREDIWALGGRVTGLPYRGDRGLVHLGAAFSYRNVDELDYSQRPEAHLAAKLVDTGAITVDRIMLAAAEAAFAAGPLHAQGEYVVSVAAATAGGDLQLGGWYAQTGVFLTGERRPYKASAGAFSRVKPRRNAFDDGGWGAWELALRASSIDLNDGAAAGGELSDYTVGLNWYLTPNARLMANYVAAVPDAWPTMHIAQARVQVDF